MPRIFAAGPLAALLLAGLIGASPSAAQEVVAVITSAQGPYEAAYASFVKTFGREVTVLRLPGRLPSASTRTRVFVAFGGGAAAQTYPENATLIACLAPGTSPRLRHDGPFVFVTMKPAPKRLLTELRRLQPGLKRLAALSNARDTDSYLADLKRTAAALDIEIIAPRASGANAVPEALRLLLTAKADALWLAPDPSLVTPENFQAIKQFSWDNDIPFYAPTRGLAAAGATAAVSVSAEEEGRLTAELARRALAGETLPELVYQERTTLTVNLESAQKTGLKINPSALGKDVEVIH